MYYNLYKTSEKVIFQPFAEGRMRNLKISLILLLFTIAIFFFYPFENTDNQYNFLIIGIVIFIFCIYDFFVQSGISLIFDGSKQIVYKKYFGLIKFKLISFDEIHNISIITTNCLHAYYLTKKGNIYGKSYKISQDYVNDISDQELYFEHVILPNLKAILKKE